MAELRESMDVTRERFEEEKIKKKDHSELIF